MYVEKVLLPRARQAYINSRLLRPKISDRIGKLIVAVRKVKEF